MDILSSFEMVIMAIKQWVDTKKADKSVVDNISSDVETMTNQMPNDLVIVDDKLYLAKDGVALDGSDVDLATISVVESIFGITDVEIGEMMARLGE